MSAVMRAIGYGILIEKRHVNDMLYALTKGLSVEQKKRFYIGHKVIEPVSYNDMEDRYKAKYDDIDIDAPDFLITDFGSHWMEYIDMYMDNYYPLLSISPTADPCTIAVYATSTRQVNKDMPNLMGLGNSVEVSSVSQSMALPPRPIPGALPPRIKPATTHETKVVMDDNVSIEITDEQKEQLSGFLRDTGISTKPETVVWSEIMTRGGWQGCIREPWRYRKNHG